MCDYTKKNQECPNFESCSYAHHVDDLRPSTDLATFKTALCFFWKKGRCFNGPKCRFAHGNHEMRSAPTEDAESTSGSVEEKNSPEVESQADSVEGTDSSQPPSQNRKKSLKSTTWQSGRPPPQQPPNISAGLCPLPLHSQFPRGPPIFVPGLPFPQPHPMFFPRPYPMHNQFPALGVSPLVWNNMGDWGRYPPPAPAPKDTPNSTPMPTPDKKKRSSPTTISTTHSDQLRSKDSPLRDNDSLHDELLSVDRTSPTKSRDLGRDQGGGGQSRSSLRGRRSQPTMKRYEPHQKAAANRRGGPLDSEGCDVSPWSCSAEKSGRRTSPKTGINGWGLKTSHRPDGDVQQGLGHDGVKGGMRSHRQQHKGGADYSSRKGCESESISEGISRRNSVDEAIMTDDERHYDRPWTMYDSGVDSNCAGYRYEEEDEHFSQTIYNERIPKHRSGGSRPIIEKASKFVPSNCQEPGLKVDIKPITSVKDYPQYPQRAGDMSNSSSGESSLLAAGALLNQGGSGAGQARRKPKTGGIGAGRNDIGFAQYAGGEAIDMMGRFYDEIEAMKQGMSKSRGGGVPMADIDRNRDRGIGSTLEDTQVGRDYSKRGVSRRVKGQDTTGQANIVTSPSLSRKLSSNITGPILPLDAGRNSFSNRTPDRANCSFVPHSSSTQKLRQASEALSRESPTSLTHPQNRYGEVDATGGHQGFESEMGDPCWSPFSQNLRMSLNCFEANKDNGGTRLHSTFPFGRDLESMNLGGVFSSVTGRSGGMSPSRSPRFNRDQRGSPARRDPKVCQSQPTSPTLMFYPAPADIRDDRHSPPSGQQLADLVDLMDDENLTKLIRRQIEMNMPISLSSAPFPPPGLQYRGTALNADLLGGLTDNNTWAQKSRSLPESPRMTFSSFSPTNLGSDRSQPDEGHPSHSTPLVSRNGKGGIPPYQPVSVAHNRYKVQAGSPPSASTRAVTGSPSSASPANSRAVDQAVAQAHLLDVTALGEVVPQAPSPNQTAGAFESCPLAQQSGKQAKKSQRIHRLAKPSLEESQFPPAPPNATYVQDFERSQRSSLGS
eukprot:GHVN01058250.1.p1 GENE.GHVN01058250.1~~GHVN01058250.1.p1  ORF type:complete len:1056 (-),score=174.16 GHVN01058250.1:987-4154(-)